MPAHLILHDLFTRIILGRPYKLRSSSLCSLLQPPAPMFYLSVRDQVSHPHKTRSKIMVLYILVFMFLKRKRKNKRLWIEW
jgi:hypothetical protein